jgi:hypothetical protein
VCLSVSLSAFEQEIPKKLSLRPMLIEIITKSQLFVCVCLSVSLSAFEQEIPKKLYLKPMLIEIITKSHLFLLQPVVTSLVENGTREVGKH